MNAGPTARLWLPYVNFTVAVAALGFQTTVLYPWHEELDKEFKKMKIEHSTMLHQYHGARMERLEKLEQQLETRVLATEHAQMVSTSVNGKPVLGLRSL